MYRELILLFLVVSFFISIILFTGRPFESFECKHNRFKRDDVLNGIVTKRTRNSKSYAHELIRLKNGQSFEWEDDNYEKDSFFYKIRIGDSLVKKENSLVMKISRIDTTFIIDLEFPCDE